MEMLRDALDPDKEIQNEGWPDLEKLHHVSLSGDKERHVQDIHDKADDKNDEYKHVCMEWNLVVGNLSDTHQIQLETVEALCGEPGCMKFYTNKQCLTAHLQTCHQYINCEICGSKKLRKNIKRHLRKHDKGGLRRGLDVALKDAS
ncbi:hypothetical protein CTI12_AA531780 [Artemisia annua]|uniref:C2H2-type domain-containing protein n=1 Tax=Artemisia annua TaxID=35608 RepID=A0A2U1L4C0_ARTAN|nr:hypothetical protein CTI12_AA531780 [Artemisia annua]